MWEKCLLQTDGYVVSYLTIASRHDGGLGPESRWDESRQQASRLRVLVLREVSGKEAAQRGYAKGIVVILEVEL
jgi:hypothetical protein